MKRRRNFSVGQTWIGEIDDFNGKTGYDVFQILSVTSHAEITLVVAIRAYCKDGIYRAEVFDEFGYCLSPADWLLTNKSGKKSWLKEKV